MGFFDKARKKFKDSAPTVYKIVDKPANLVAVTAAAGATVITAGATGPLLTKSMENLIGKKARTEKSGQPGYASYGAWRGSQSSILLENLSTVIEYYYGNPAEGTDPTLTALSKDVKHILQSAEDQRQQEWCDLVMKHRDNPIRVPDVDGRGIMHTRNFPTQEEIDSCSGPVMRSGPR